MGRLGALALIGGARADTPADTALARRDGDNVTTLHPYSKGAQTRQERAFNPDNVTPEVLERFKKLGMKHPEQFIQSIQTREQRQKMRRLAQKAQEHPEVLERVRKLFEEMPEQKSHEPERRKLDIPGPCLQGGPPPWDPPTLVTGTAAPVEGGGTAVTVNYDLNTINACLDSITPMLDFLTTTTYTCPADCTPGTTAPSDRSFAGMPSTIDPHAVSTATGTDILWCVQTDSNGGTTPTVPDSITTLVIPQGVMNGGGIQGMPEVFNVYP